MNVRCCDDDLGVHELLVELAVLALLVRGRHKRVALVLEPFPDAELVLRRSEQARLLLGVLVALQRKWSALKLQEARGRGVLRRRGRGGLCPVETRSRSAS